MGESEAGRGAEKMETLDFSCSPRKREEVDGKALASDKTVLSHSSFSLSFALAISIVVILFSSCTSVSFIAAECGAAFLSRIQILCEKVRSTLESAATDDGKGRRKKKNVDGASKRV